MTRSHALPAGTTLLLALLVGPAPVAQASDAGPWRSPLGAEGVDVARGFDPPRTTYGAGHRGVDLRAAAGVTVHSAGAGRVSYASVLAGRGVVVVVHGELRTTYEPVTASVSVGSRVGAGARLGTLETSHPGHPSCAPSACLHWGLRRGETYLDPLRLLHRSPSVLLPLTSADRSLMLAPRRLADLPAVRGEHRTDGVRLPRPTAAPAEASEGWSLRSADLPLAAGALLALLAGLALLVRRSNPGPGPAPDPDDPPVAPALSTQPEALFPFGGHQGDLRGPRSPGWDDPHPPTHSASHPVDLGLERTRRRPA